MKKRLLFVDDEPSIRVTLPAILHNEGFDVTVASNVSEALQAIQNNRFDHVPRLLGEIADRIEKPPSTASETAIQAAKLHGRQRYEHGFTIPMLLVESAILEKTVADLLQENLLAIDISTLIHDMRQMSAAINYTVEISVRAFLELSPEPKAA